MKTSHFPLFWFGLLHSDPSHQATYRAVMETLTPFLVANPRLLQIVASDCGATYDSTDREDSDSSLSNRNVCLDALKRIVRAAAFPGKNPVAIAVVVEHQVDDDGFDTSETLLVLEKIKPLPHVTIERLALQLPPRLPRHPPPDGVDADVFSLTRMLRSLGELLRTVLSRDGAAHKTRVLAITRCHRYDYRLVGAALSIVPRAVTLEELRGGGMVQGGGDKLLRLVWLAYVLFPRERTSSPLELSVRSFQATLSQDESRYLCSLVACGTPLRDVVSDALRSRYGDPSRVAVNCLAVGSTATLARGCWLYSQPGRVLHDLSSRERTERIPWTSRPI